MSYYGYDPYNSVERFEQPVQLFPGCDMTEAQLAALVRRRIDELASGTVQPIEFPFGDYDV